MDHISPRQSLVSFCYHMVFGITWGKAHRLFALSSFFKWSSRTACANCEAGAEGRLPQGVSFERVLASFLLQYRTTPHATTGVSPSSLFFGWILWIQLDLLKPQVAARVQSKQADQKSFHDLHSCARHFSVGESVMVRNLRDGPPWVIGVVVLGPLSYVIQVHDGQRWKCHVVHICEGPSMLSGTLENNCWWTDLLEVLLRMLDMIWRLCSEQDQNWLCNRIISIVWGDVYQPFNCWSHPICKPWHPGAGPSKYHPAGISYCYWSHGTSFACLLVTYSISAAFKKAFDAIFPAFVCVLLWWRRRRALRHRRRIAKRMAYKRRMTRLTLMQDWYFWQRCWTSLQRWPRPEEQSGQSWEVKVFS